MHSDVRRTPYAIKEGQSLPRIMETLTVAVEFINLPTLANQLPALEELRKETLRSVLGMPCEQHPHCFSCHIA
jgi:hypothetical protein